MKNNGFSHAYIDSDVLRYRCGFACEYTLYHVKGLDEPFRGVKKYREFLKENPQYEQTDYAKQEVVEPPENAIHIAKNYIAQTERVLQCPTTLILSGDTNFREDIATIQVYKGNRPDRKPKCYDEITEWMKKQGAVVTDGIEADDLLAIRASVDNGVICTVDKDLLQVPGWHYNFVNDTLQYVDEEQGMFNLFVQILMGDSTDNIQGIPGIGQKKAEKILQGDITPEEMYKSVVQSYMMNFGEDWEYHLNETANLVYILRYPEDKWEPPISTEDLMDG